MNIRERLREMAARPGMWAATREGFLMQVMVLLEVLDIDAKTLLRIGAESECSAEHLREPILAPEDEWATEVANAALTYLPPGSGSFSFVQVEPPPPSAFCLAVDAHGKRCTRLASHPDRGETHRNDDGADSIQFDPIVGAARTQLFRGRKS